MAVRPRNGDTARVLRPRVNGGGSHWRRAGVMAAALLGVLLLLGPARPANAHVRVFVGGAIGFPVPIPVSILLSVRGTVPRGPAAGMGAGSLGDALRLVGTAIPGLGPAAPPLTCR